VLENSGSRPFQALCPSAVVAKWTIQEQRRQAVENGPGGHGEIPGIAVDDRSIAPSTLARIAWFEDPDGNLLSVSQHPAD
jgi:hypothetical protein